MYRSMVGGEYSCMSFLCYVSEERGCRRVEKPRSTESAECGIGWCEFAYHLRLCKGVREDVGEVEYDDVEVVLFEGGEVA